MLELQIPTGSTDAIVVDGDAICRICLLLLIDESGEPS
jgi:hypothetical protein